MTIRTTLFALLLLALSALPAKAQTAADPKPFQGHWYALVCAADNPKDSFAMDFQFTRATGQTAAVYSPFTNPILSDTNDADHRGKLEYRVEDDNATHLHGVFQNTSNGYGFAFNLQVIGESGDLGGPLELKDNEGSTVDALMILTRPEAGGLGRFYDAVKDLCGDLGKQANNK